MEFAVASEIPTVKVFDNFKLFYISVQFNILEIILKGKSDIKGRNYVP